MMTLEGLVVPRLLTRLDRLLERQERLIRCHDQEKVFVSVVFENSQEDVGPLLLPCSSWTPVSNSWSAGPAKGIVDCIAFLYGEFGTDFFKTLLEFYHTSIELQRPVLPAFYLLDIDQQCQEWRIALQHIDLFV
ncbi:hypothetical protein Tco_0418006 [Tanacetum coccineum]